MWIFIVLTRLGDNPISVQIRGGDEAMLYVIDEKDAQVTEWYV